MALPLNTGTKYATKLLIFFGVLLFLYTATRACLLSITWDEAFSYLQFVRHHILIPVKYESMDANNHLLNTWLDIQLIKCFGVNEFVLRLPALFAHLLFLVFSYKFVKGFENKWIALASFLVINLNPYLLDFFSLSRGYGLSIGLMMSSVYYLYVFVTSGCKTKYAILSVIIGALATLANFVVLNYFLVSFGLILLLIISYVYHLHDLSSKKKLMLFTRSSVWPLFIFAVTLLIIVPIVFRLKNAGALYYGGNKGFWADTIISITDRCFYEKDYGYWIQRLAKGLLIILFAGASLFTLFSYIKKRTTEQHLFLAVLITLIAFIALSTIVQHQVFETPYLMERTALFFVPLFNLMVVFFIKLYCTQNEKIKYVLYWAAIFSVFHFAVSCNFNYVLEWKSDAVVKQMVKDIDATKLISKEKNNVSVYCPLAYSQAINFYRTIGNRTGINSVQPSADVNLLNDYLCLEQEQYKKINPNLVEVVKHYPITNAFLVKPYKRPKYIKVGLIKNENFETLPDKKNSVTPEIEYGPGFACIIGDSLTPLKNAEVVFKAVVSAPSTFLLYTSIVCSFENKEGVYVWKRMFVKDFIQYANNWTEVYFTSIVPSDAKPGDVVKFYIWNPNKITLDVKQVELKWLNYCE